MPLTSGKNGSAADSDLLPRTGAWRHEVRDVRGVSWVARCLFGR